jgi:hypothetical protein
MKPCRCGCGEIVPDNRTFLNQEHSRRWMSGGGARELNILRQQAAGSSKRATQQTGSEKVDESSGAGKRSARKATRKRK